MTQAKPLHPRQRTIAVDVDGTLWHAGSGNAQVIAWCTARKAEGYSLMLWSAAGQQHAQEVADLLGVAHLFDAILSKPGYILDDAGWAWIKYTKVVTHREIGAMVTLDTEK